MKSRIQVIVVVMLVLGASCISQEVGGRITETDYSLVYKDNKTTLGFGVTVDLATKLLGSGNVVTLYDNKKNPGFSKMGYSWDSIKLTVFKGSGKINSIRVLTSDFHTPRGVTIGDTIIKVKQKYGVATMERNNNIEYDLPTEEAVWALLFYFDNEKVKYIEIVRAP
jgi:hypothetical protein